MNRMHREAGVGWALLTSTKVIQESDAGRVRARSKDTSFGCKSRLSLQMMRTRFAHTLSSKGTVVPPLYNTPDRNQHARFTTKARYGCAPSPKRLSSGALVVVSKTPERIGRPVQSLMVAAASQSTPQQRRSSAALPSYPPARCGMFSGWRRNERKSEWEALGKQLRRSMIEDPSSSRRITKSDVAGITPQHVK